MSETENSRAGISHRLKGIGGRASHLRGAQVEQSLSPDAVAVAALPEDFNRGLVETPAWKVSAMQLSRSSLRYSFWRYIARMLRGEDWAKNFCRNGRPTLHTQWPLFMSGRSG